MSRRRNPTPLPVTNILSHKAIDFIDNAFTPESAPLNQVCATPAQAAPAYMSNEIIEGPPSFLEAQGVRYVPAPLAVEAPLKQIQTPAAPMQAPVCTPTPPVPMQTPFSTQTVTTQSMARKPLSVSARVDQTVRKCMASSTSDHCPVPRSVGREYDDHDVDHRLEALYADMLESERQTSAALSARMDAMSRRSEKLGAPASVHYQPRDYGHDCDHQLEALYADSLESERQTNAALSARMDAMSRRSEKLGAPASVRYQPRDDHYEHVDSCASTDSDDDEHAGNSLPSRQMKGYCDVTKPAGRLSHLTRW